VGHEMAALTEARTFDSLYVQPLKTIIDGMNPKDPFTVNQTTPKRVRYSTKKNPIFMLFDHPAESSTRPPIFPSNF
jgi:hypothetical protein